MSKTANIVLWLIVVILWVLAMRAVAISGDDYKDYVPHVPTGCPYGDSIPLDDPKCVPPPVEAVQPIAEPTPEPVKAKTCDL